MINSRKRKASERDNIFTSKSNKKAALSRGRSQSALSNFAIRSKSKEELDHLYQRKVQEVKKKYENLLKKNPRKVVGPEIISELKRCEECHDFVNSNFMILCDYCEDAYHMYCLTPPLERRPVGVFPCPSCQKQLDEEGTVPTKLKGFNKTIKKVQKKCFGCKENICQKSRSQSLDRSKANIHASALPEDDSLKNCFKCLKDFHLKCFRKDWKNLVIPTSTQKSKKCKIICDNCEKSIQTKLLKVTRISDFFKPQKNSKGKADLNHKDHKDHKDYKDSKFSKINSLSWDKRVDDISQDSTSLDIGKAKSYAKSYDAKFRLPKELTKDQKRILQESFLRALEVKGITFGDDLNFEDKECPSHMNDASLEVGMQKISEYNKEIYYKFKKKTREAEYPPLEIVDDDIQGFIVKATDEIPMLTLITEYTGDVSLARNKIFDKNDSIMDLLKTPSSSTSLVICPEKKSNLARFISGINNHDEKSAKKQNVKSIKYDIDGSAHILLYASRTIKKNETLYYDYNAGGHKTYPTAHFI